MSVPNQKAADGALSRLIGDTACGSIVPSQGAAGAMPIIATRSAPPMSAVGWRLNASRKRRHVGDTDLAGAIGAAAIVEAISSGCAGRRTRTRDPRTG